MSDSTWQLVRQKRDWRATLHEAQALQRSTLLNAIFAVWRGVCPHGDIELGVITSFDSIMCGKDRLIATALHEFRRLGALVTQASRADDIRFFQNTMQEGTAFLQPHQSRDLWRVIKKALPKYQQRRQGVDPLRLLHLESEWNRHFEHLEAGRPVDAQALLTDVSSGPDDLLAPPSWRDVPTLFDLEHVLRSNKTGRATGNDPLTSDLHHNHAADIAEHSFSLMVKMWVWGIEPVQFKGGPPALLPKQPQPAVASHFRGILLLPTLAKAFHALLRKDIIRLLHPIRLPGQLGGFGQQEVLFGSQALRILGRAAAERHFNVGVLFVDLSTAFHCLIREMVVGVSNPAKLDFVVDALRQKGHPCDHLRLGRELPGLLLELGAPRHLVRLLQNIHSNTWMTIGQHGIICTHKGTRPGSPLADAIFHFIMYDVSLALRSYLRDEGHLDFISCHLHMDIDMIIWSDDLAIPVITSTGAALVPALLRLLDHVRELFLQRGFVLNLAKGKTGIVASFCGCDAPALRREFQLVPQPGTDHVFPDGSSSFIHFMPAYRHLGTLYTSDHKLDAEISARIGLAASAFSQLSRRLLTNRHLPCKLRLQLFGSLVLSKLYFAIGSWHTPTGRQLDRIRVALVRMLRKILGVAAGPHGSSSAQILIDAAVPDPRVRLAMDRLLYAHRLFHHGPAFLQMMVHSELSQHSNSWLCGLRHDLQWLHVVESRPDPLLLDPDHSALIEHWQSAPGNWKGRVQRAGRRHLFQESMLLEAQHWHAQIFGVLRSHSFTFFPDPALLHLQEGTFSCPDCAKVFTTPQGVHTHRRKVHGVFSPEHHLLDSATCPACLRFFWSTQRLQQHLAYMPRSGAPNACFAHLQSLGYAVTYSATALPSAMQGQSRLDSLPVAGPIWIGPTSHQREVDRLIAVRHRLQTELGDFEVPEDDLVMGERLAALLTSSTQQWFRAFCDHGFSTDGIAPLRDRWIDILRNFWRKRPLQTLLAICMNINLTFKFRSLTSVFNDFIKNKVQPDHIALFDLLKQIAARDLCLCWKYHACSPRKIVGRLILKRFAGMRCLRIPRFLLYQDWLRGLRFWSCTSLLGGDDIKIFMRFFLDEHPDIPIQDHHPSIWRSAILKFFRKHPDIVLHHVRQWRFGASSVKPTGLLALRLPHFARDLYAKALPDARRPESHAIGMDSEGHFRTSSHKEYPPALSAGLANVIAQQLQRVCRGQLTHHTATPAPALCQWISDVSRASAMIRQSAAWLPDYQG
eukprot:s232_g18.t1